MFAWDGFNWCWRFRTGGKSHSVRRIQAGLQRLQLHEATGRNVEPPLVSGASDREL